MEKFRINDIGTIEIRLLNDRIQFTTTPDHQETIAEVSTENAIKIANKLLAWAKTTDENSGLHLQNVIARFFEITDEDVDMLKLLLHYKREIESDKGEGLSDDEYDDYESLESWFENGL
jgi:hypothetical protein